MSIFDLLHKSPFKPMQEHMRIAVRCANEVPGLFEALIAGDEEELKRRKDEIFRIEMEADNLKNDMRIHLPKRLFMPVARRDLLEVLDHQDSIADVAQDIAGLLVERKFEVPKALEEPLRKLVAECVSACEFSLKIVEELDELLTAGFRGKEADRVESMCTELNGIENTTDELGMALATVLFDHEDEMKPISVVFWYQIIQWIGDLADHAEKVGNRFRLLIAQ